MLPDLFKGGTLEMPVEPVPLDLAVRTWGDCMVNRIAVIFSLILLVLSLVDLLRLYPHLLRCVVIWKGNLELEHSVSLARTRNNLALVTMLILCIIADRWNMVNPSFKAALPEKWHLAVTAGLILGYLVLRRLLYLISRFRSRTAEYDCTLRHSVYNCQIVLTSLLMVSALVLSAFRVPDYAVKVVLLIETAAVALLYFVRSGQIFSSRFSLFATILYLCALEILPLGILVFVCTL